MKLSLFLKAVSRTFNKTISEADLVGTNFPFDSRGDFYRTQVYLGSELWVQMSTTPCCNLIDVTLADEDTNSILTDNANKAIQGNVAMQVMQPDRLFIEMK